jgi:hypothetical protein
VAKFYPLQLLFERVFHIMNSYRVILWKPVFCTFNSRWRLALAASKVVNLYVFFIEVASQTIYFKIITTPPFVRELPFLSPSNWTNNNNNHRCKCNVGCITNFVGLIITRESPCIDHALTNIFMKIEIVKLVVWLPNYTNR